MTHTYTWEITYTYIMDYVYAQTNLAVITSDDGLLPFGVCL